MEPLFFLKGVNGQLSVYTDKVIIERQGVLGFLSQGLAGSKSIPITSIQSVQFKKGGLAFNGFIQFGILGGKEMSKGVFNASQDENTIMFRISDNADALKIKEHIEQIIMSKNDISATASNQLSSAEEIKKFKELLDQGIISQEEFDLKKNKLLGL